MKRNVAFLGLLLLALLAISLNPGSVYATAPSTWQVSAAFDDGTCATTHLCQTIQHAVDLATAGDTVLVLPGAYVEQVDIGKNLTLQGQGAASIIQSPAALATKFTTPSNKKPIVYAHNATVTIQYLMVDGNGQGNANNQFLGIAYYNAGGAITHTSVVHVRDTPASGVQHGVGIYAYNQDGASRTLNVLDNTVSDFQKNGMALMGNGLTVNVQRNTVTGAGPISYTAQNGIQVSDGATGKVGPLNTVSGISYTGSGWSATSILVIESNVDIQFNTVTNGMLGIYMIEGNSNIVGNTVTASTAGVGQPGYWGIVVDDPPPAQPSPFDAGSSPKQSRQTSGPSTPSGGPMTVNVIGNRITTTGPVSDNSTGLEADAGYPGYGSANMAFYAASNLISGWTWGVGLYQCTSGCSGGTFTSVAFNYNSITGNTTGADSNVAVDGTRNWWGSAAGPGAGGNNGVTGLVTTGPYARALTTGPTASTHEIGETGTFNTNVTVNGLYGVQFVADHDPAILTFTSGISHTVGTAPNDWDWNSAFMAKNFAAGFPAAGQTTLAATLRRDLHPNAANLTDANMATWTYTCTVAGTSLLSYDTTAGTGTFLSDINGFNIPTALLGDSITCVAPTASVSGVIALQGRLQGATSPAGWNGAVVTLTCSSAACTGSGPYVFPATDTNGNYQIIKAGAGTGVTTGDYTATVTRRAYLSAARTTVTIAAGSNTITPTPTLLGGDINNDNTIDIGDLSAMGGSFGASITADTGADVNGDGFVNIFDLVLAGGNYGLTAPQSW
ncbi:MAG: hypothetical protein WCF84_04135 [Anaerolineae bacterium]